MSNIGLLLNNLETACFFQNEITLLNHIGKLRTFKILWKFWGTSILFLKLLRKFGQQGLVNLQDSSENSFGSFFFFIFCTNLALQLLYIYRIHQRIHMGNILLQNSLWTDKYCHHTLYSLQLCHYFTVNSPWRNFIGYLKQACCAGCRRTPFLMKLHQ